MKEGNKRLLSTARGDKPTPLSMPRLDWTQVHRDGAFLFSNPFFNFVVDIYIHTKFVYNVRNKIKYKE